MMTCSVVIAIVLGICSISAVDMRVGQITFASAGWLSLAMALMVCYAALNYFVHYWCDRSVHGFRKGRVLLEERIGQLSANAREHFHRIGSGTLTDTQIKEESEIGDAKNAALRSVAFHLNMSRALFFAIYGLIPGALVVIALIVLAAQASWQFSSLPPVCGVTGSG